MTLFVSAFAANKDLEKDVTMVSYEQSWKDLQGTLALRNNTEEEIKNVVFLITYLDMSGNEVDYEEFSKEVSIAPGMTKKIDITAYEHNRCYHYYKSEGVYDNTSFKIKFQLKDYNVEPNELPGSGNGLHSYWFMSIIVLFIAIGITVGIFVLVAVMAKKRNRNAALWILLSIIATPMLVIIILLCIGKAERNTDSSSIQ